MLEGKFRDRTHLGCGYPLYLATPVSIAWSETGYFAKCPRCLADLPVDVVDPDTSPEPVKPDEIPKGMYWCPSCKSLHRRTSEKGTKHLKYLEPEE